MDIWAVGISIYAGLSVLAIVVGAVFRLAQVADEIGYKIRDGEDFLNLLLGALVGAGIGIGVLSVIALMGAAIIGAGYGTYLFIS